MAIFEVESWVIVEGKEKEHDVELWSCGAGSVG